MLATVASRSIQILFATRLWNKRDGKPASQVALTHQFIPNLHVRSHAVRQSMSRPANRSRSSSKALPSLTLLRTATTSTHRQLRNHQLCRPRAGIVPSFQPRALLGPASTVLDTTAQCHPRPPLCLARCLRSHDSLQTSPGGLLNQSQPKPVAPALACLSVAAPLLRPRRTLTTLPTPHPPRWMAKAATSQSRRRGRRPSPPPALIALLTPCNTSPRRTCRRSGRRRT